MINDALRSARENPANAEAAGRLGMVLHAHDQFSTAVICYRRASVLEPSRVEYFYYQGAALSSDGKYQDAIQPLKKAVSINPRLVPARLKLAEALLETGRTAEAREAYIDIIQQDAEVAAAHYGLGRASSGGERMSEFERALQIFPRYGAARFALAAEYRRNGRAADAERTLAGYEKNRAATPPLDDPLLAAVVALNAGPTGLLRRAQALERQGQLTEAVAACERAVEQYPAFEQAWINLVSLYGRLRLPEKLEDAYQHAIRLAPNNGDAYYNYGVYCFQAGRYEDARKAFENTARLDPRNADAWNNLGALAERSGAWDRAADYYRKAIAARPDFRLSHFHLGRIYANQGRYAEAISEFERSLEPRDDQTPAYMYALAATHARAGHRQQSVELLAKAREEAAALGQSALVSSIDRDMQTLRAAR